MNEVPETVGKKSRKDTWRTPPEVFAWASSLVRFGFDYDAACTMENRLAPPLWTLGGFVPGDSLSAPWPDEAMIWCNPPYSNIDPWVDQVLATRALVGFFILSPNGEARYERICQAAHEYHIIGRVSFIDEDGEPKGGNERGSSLFLFNTWGRGGRTIITRDAVFEIGTEVLRRDREQGP